MTGDALLRIDGRPCAAVPLPGGNPVPSGMMVMSQAAISASVIGLPSFGASAAIATEPNGTDQRSGEQRSYA